MRDMIPEVNKLYIEVTNYCNFRCEFCPLRLSGREKMHMDFDLFTKVIDDVSRHGLTDTIGFHVVGEPMMYPAIFQAIRYANENGLQTELTTNGSLLTLQNNREIDACGLNRLTISLQRFGADDHVARRASMSFDRYYTRILESVRFFSRANSSTEVLVLFMNAATRHLFDVTLPTGVEWDRRNHKNDLAKIVADTYQAAGNSGSLDQVATRVRKLSAFRASGFRIAQNIWVVVRPFFDWGNAFSNDRLYMTSFGFCNLAFSSLGILSNGEVIICCADYDGDTTIGNVRENSLNDILLGDVAQSLARGFDHYRLVHPRCQQCFASTNPAKTVIKSVVVTVMCKFIKPGPGHAQNEINLMEELAV